MNAHRHHSYGSIHSPAKSPRAAEATVLAQITRGIAVSSTGDTASFPRLAQALSDNRRFWTTVATDLRGEGNALPPELKKNLLQLTVFVDRETSRVLARDVTPETLIAINRSIISGLGDGDFAA